MYARGKWYIPHHLLTCSVRIKPAFSISCVDALEHPHFLNIREAGVCALMRATTEVVALPFSGQCCKTCNNIGVPVCALPHHYRLTPTDYLPSGPLWPSFKSIHRHNRTQPKFSLSFKTKRKNINVYLILDPLWRRHRLATICGLVVRASNH